MKLFIRNSIIFLVFLFLFTEIMARVLHIRTDAPKTYKNRRGNIRFYPNQEGYWNGGQHKWYINALGLPGKEYPESNKNLISIIGDSFIQNFMNPDSCRQSLYLHKYDKKNNYIEMSRDGADLLEYFEFVKELDTIKPKLNIMYVNTEDFKESIYNYKQTNYLRLNLENKKLIFPPYQGSKFKDVLYNFKFVYYLYRKNLKLFQGSNKGNNITKTGRHKNEIFEDDLKKYSQLLKFIKKNYKTDNVIFIFHPGVSQKLIELTKKFDYRSMQLVIPNDENWTLKGDSHWSCFGHRQVAKQVSLFTNKFDR